MCSLKKQDYVVEHLIQLDESLREIATDISGFRNIRHRLFQVANAEPENKLYLYLFHLFESLVNNVATFIGKSTGYAFTELREDLLKLKAPLETKEEEGFFQENLRSIIHN